MLWASPSFKQIFFLGSIFWTLMNTLFVDVIGAFSIISDNSSRRYMWHKHNLGRRYLPRVLINPHSSGLQSTFFTSTLLFKLMFPPHGLCISWITCPGRVSDVECYKSSPISIYDLCAWVGLSGATMEDQSVVSPCLKSNLYSCR